ncbi:MAG: BrnA antitoxin family protein [Stellaceae bacterium]
MKKRKPLTDDEGEVRELTSADLKDFRGAEEILSPPLMQKLSVQGRAGQEALTKERITIRLSRDVVEKFRATGEGWQTRLDAALRDWLQTHSPN